MFSLVYSFILGIGCGVIIPGYYSVQCIKMDVTFNNAFVFALLSIAFVLSLCITFKNKEVYKQSILNDLKFLFVITIFINKCNSYINLIILMLLNHSEIKIRKVIYQYATILSLRRTAWNYGLMVGVAIQFFKLYRVWFLVIYILILFVLHNQLLKSQHFKERLTCFNSIYKKKKFKSISLLSFISILPKYILLYLTVLTVKFLHIKHFDDIFILFLMQIKHEKFISIYFFLITAHIVGLFGFLVESKICTVMADFLVGISCSYVIEDICIEFKGQDIFLGDIVNCIACILFLCVFWFS